MHTSVNDKVATDFLCWTFVRAFSQSRAICLVSVDGAAVVEAFGLQLHVCRIIGIQLQLSWNPKNNTHKKAPDPTA
jgi:p-aminobenzoyl-glutamate transporter AbgT